MKNFLQQMPSTWFSPRRAFPPPPPPYSWKHFSLFSEFLSQNSVIVYLASPKPGYEIIQARDCGFYLRSLHLAQMWGTRRNLACVSRRTGFCFASKFRAISFITVLLSLEQYFSKSVLDMPESFGVLDLKNHISDFTSVLEVKTSGCRGLEILNEHLM